MPFVGTEQSKDYKSVVTKTWNDLKPPKTIHNHLKKFNNQLQPSTTTSKNLQTLANNLKPSKTRYKCLK